jgi:hypothetical protein
VGRVTHALEEFDSLLALQIFELAVLLDEFLLINGKLYTL